MADRAAGVRLASLLWFIAAVAAWIAVAIRYARRDYFSWTWAIAGVFCVAMGISAWKRARSVTSAAPPQNRDLPHN